MNGIAWLYYTLKVLEAVKSRLNINQPEVVLQIHDECDVTASRLCVWRFGRVVPPRQNSWKLSLKLAKTCKKKKNIKTISFGFDWAIQLMVAKILMMSKRWRCWEFHGGGGGGGWWATMGAAGSSWRRRPDTAAVQPTPPHLQASKHLQHTHKQSWDRALPLE